MYILIAEVTCLVSDEPNSDLRIGDDGCGLIVSNAELVILNGPSFNNYVTIVLQKAKTGKLVKGVAKVRVKVCYGCVSCR